jgi:hypothetical protein
MKLAFEDENWNGAPSDWANVRSDGVSARMEIPIKLVYVVRCRPRGGKYWVDD